MREWSTATVTATTRQKSESGLRSRPSWRDRSENCSQTRAQQCEAKINIVPKVGREDMGCAASRARAGLFSPQRAGKIYRDRPKSGKFTVNFPAHPTLRTLRPPNGHFTPLYTMFLHFPRHCLVGNPSFFTHVEYL